MKFGLKLWSINYGLAEESEKLIGEGVFDYVELMVIPGTQILPFQKIKVPYIIHATSDKYGLNIADKNKENLNIDLISQSIEWADKLYAKYLILHPGFGQIKTAKNFLKKINDGRILIENMPKLGVNGERMVGFSAEQMMELTNNKFGLCLDFGHAIKAARSLKKDYIDYLKKFIKLQPKVLHISGGTFKSEVDEHLSIDDGDFNYKALMLLSEESGAEYMTLETRRKNMDSLSEDVSNVNLLKSFQNAFIP